MLSFCVAQEVHGRTQEGGASFIRTVKALSDSPFRKMLVLNVPLPTITARIFVFPLTRACFLIPPPAKGAIQLGCSILGGVVDWRDVCKRILLIHDKIIDL
jgi:hypothetical protein